MAVVLNHHRRLRFIALAVRPAVVAVLWSVVMTMVFSGCYGKSPTVHFILPNGYRGPFGIKLDQPDGVSLEFKNGVYTCVIPENGMLHVKGKGPFEEWHSVTASYVNGDPIPVEYSDPPPPDNAVALRSLFNQTDGTVRIIWYMIGTKAEWNEARLKDPKDLKPGGVTKR